MAKGCHIQVKTGQTQWISMIVAAFLDALDPTIKRLKGFCRIRALGRFFNCLSFVAKWWLTGSPLKIINSSQLLYFGKCSLPWNSVITSRGKGKAWGFMRCPNLQPSGRNTAGRWYISVLTRVNPSLLLYKPSLSLCLKLSHRFDPRLHQDGAEKSCFKTCNSEIQSN